ncbi:hypothetical protein EGM51_08025 [Verrucomicrobia bacterium S94]|nr:hypothetical protein EGM51_08025 [Verrucomicrobia bacterium S94]
MKTWSWLVIGLFSVSVNAESLILHNGGSGFLTTGDLLDEADKTGITTNVVEIPDLKITARSGDAGQKINTTATSLGVTVHGTGDDTDRFEYGESIILSFDKQVQIKAFDMVGFNSNSVFTVAVAGKAPFDITYGDLPNKVVQFYSTNLIVEAHNELTLYVGNTNSVIGLQTIDLDVLDGSGDLSLSLKTSNDWVNIAAEFNGTAAANYVLQSSTNLASNVWNAVSESFSMNTNWTFSATNEAGFYRVVEQ